MWVQKELIVIGRQQGEGRLMDHRERQEKLCKSKRFGLKTTENEATGLYMKWTEENMV